MEDLSAVLLGGAPTLTRLQVAEQSGVPPAEAQAMWRAMGFADVEDHVRAFTPGDVAALQTVQDLLALGVVDADTLLVLARAMGQGLSRLAEAQVDVLRRLSEGMTVEEALQAATTAADDVVPQLEQLVLFVWRRQFAAAVLRSTAAARHNGMTVMAVGFVDLVDFTRSTRGWDTSQLAGILEHFERHVALRVAAVGGRVVKSLGDGVLFVTDDARRAARVALETVEAHEAHEELPSVRAGVALGPLLVRLGDVFGEPVNIASRLTDEARPGTVLVDDRAAEALAEEADLALQALHRRSVRGYRSLVPHLLRRAAP